MKVSYLTESLRPLGAVWVDENNIIYSGGFYLYRYKNNSWNYVTSLPENYLGGNPCCTGVNIFHKRK